MRITHISYSGTGGAGRAARRAHKACRSAGLDSRLLVAYRPDLDSGDLALTFDAPIGGVEARTEEFVRSEVQWGYIKDNRIGASNTLVSLGYFGADLNAVPFIQESDVVHLHWTPWVASPNAIRELLDDGRQVFWTLHDQWAMTGGCHYTDGCDQYRSACRKCPQLEDEWRLIPAAFQDKQECYGGGRRGLHVICPSQWLGDTARNSAIFSHTPISVVPNPIETDLFNPPENRRILRSAYGIRNDAFVLLFGNFDNSEKRKGADILRQSLHILSESGRLKAVLGGRPIIFAVFGKAVEFDFFEFPGVSVVMFEEITDDAVLSDIYGLSDALAFPSLEDNYPNTVLEAAACGLPSIAFVTGGLPEMISHGSTGWLTEPVGDAAALADAIEAFADLDEPTCEAMRGNCRRKVESANSLEAVGGQLFRLYSQESKLTAQSAPAPSAELLLRAAKARKSIHGPLSIKTGPRFLQHPLREKLFGAAVKEEALTEEEAIEIRAAAPRRLHQDVEGRLRVTTVNSFHSHHSAHSGPAQFTKHLSSELVCLQERQTPMGYDLLREQGYAMQELLRGSISPAYQANGLATEFDILMQCFEGGVDVVHFIDGEHCGLLLAALMPAMRRSKRPTPRVTATFHQPPNILRPLVSRQGLSLYDRIIALCGEQADFLREAGGGDRVVIIPHGIDTEHFMPGAQTKNQNSDVIRLIAVGHWLRDYETLLEAVAELERRNEEVRLEIVCHNWSLSREFGPQVTLLENISDQELLAAYQEADALLLPLHDATANNAILEAMACGLPIISTDIGGVSEMAPPNCSRLAPPGDAAALADAVIELKGNSKLRAEMGACARRNALDLAWPKVAEKHHALYHEMALMT